MVKVGAPAETRTEVSSAAPAERQATPADGGAAGDDAAAEAGLPSSPTQQGNPPLPGRLNGVAVVYGRLRVWLQAAARPARRLLVWTHTPLALRLGTAVTALLAVATVAGVLIVGVAGVGVPNSYYCAYLGQMTHSAAACDAAVAPNTYAGVNPQDTLSIFPQPHSYYGPPLPEFPHSLAGSLASAPPDLALNAALSEAVLQPRDLTFVFPSEGEGPADSDPLNGLLASYHEVRQRSGTESAAFPGLVAVLSDVGLYQDSATASAQLTLLDDGQLGADAGFPDMAAATLTADQVGNESRVVELRGTAAGRQVVIDLVQFREGNAVGLVGAAAVDDGSDPDLLNQAVALATTQDIHMVGLSAQAPPANPSTGAGLQQP